MMLSRFATLSSATGGGTPTDPNFANVSCLLHGNGTNGSTVITDSSSNNLTFTRAGDAQISTLQSKFGGSSIKFDGTGDYISTPDNTVFDFGTSPFTIESWVYFNNFTNSPFIFHQLNTNASDSAGWFLEAAANTIYFGHGVQTTAAYQAFAVTLAAGVWNHIAVTRSGTSLNCFVNGVSPGAVTKAAASSSYDKTTPVVIGGGGATYYTTSNLNGYINDFRITKGLVRYSSNFTPPTAAFPDS